MLAMFLLPGGGVPAKAKSDVLANLTAAGAVSTGLAVSHSDDGPWSAVCGEYETAFEHGKEHLPQDIGTTGAWGHTAPESADPDELEYTRHTIDSQAESLRQFPLGESCLRAATEALNTIRSAEIRDEQHTSKDTADLSCAVNAAMNHALPYPGGTGYWRDADACRSYLALRFLSR